MSDARVAALREAWRRAQTYGIGQKFIPGRFTLEVEKIFFNQANKNGAIENRMICEFKVLASSVPDIEIGSIRSYNYNMQQVNWLPRFKMMVWPLLGVDPDQKIPKEADEAAEDIYVALMDDSERVRLGFKENPLGGLTAHVEFFAGKSAKNNFDILQSKWSPVKEVAT